MKALDSLTDAELSEAVAVEVAGWTRGWKAYEWTSIQAGTKQQIQERANPKGWVDPDGAHYTVLLPYATSADAVLPLLEAAPWFFINSANGSHIVGAMYENGKNREAAAPTFPRAACLALLLAAREKGTP